MRRRMALISGFVVAVLATGCTGSDEVAGDTTTSPAPDVTTTITVPPTSATETVTTRDVASAAIALPDGYSYRNGADAAALEQVDVGINWVPDGIVSEIVYEVLSTPSDDTVSVVSVIPSVEWRGAPDLPQMLVELLSGTEATANDDRIVETSSAEGDPLFLWSTGDGFLIALADDADDAVAYLGALESIRSPQSVWQPGSCLMLPGGEFPYAPFPMDLVVPCSSPHNAEVIAAEFRATEATSYDADAIELDRAYACDQAYSATFGPEIDHRPGLVTYMPDEAEWDRGDRYRACVVSITTNGAAEVFEGAMTDRDDLDWGLEPGDCLPSTIKDAPLECSSVHVHEYLGMAEVSFEEWPRTGEGAFDAACETYRADLVDGPVDIGIWAFGLGPYEFDNGARTVRCLAFALGDTAPTLVAGSFTDTWRIVGDAVGV